MGIGTDQQEQSALEQDHLVMGRVKEEHGCTENVKLLLANGADTTMRTASGKSAADLAWQQGYNMIISLLEQTAVSQSERPWWKFW
jgi:hypothetical protein